ncbi:MAG: pseudouridine synthase [Thermosynechococcaceae cyanobacterium MS004]|nr:pseudouridine synthase [Thermosynechococcaceae cyanobacterium MS004]
MNQGWCYYNRVDRQSVGLNVLTYYTQRYTHSNEAEWRSRIDAGQITVNGNIAAADWPLQVGQQLIYHRPPWVEPAAPLTFEVLYEDVDLLVIVKPSGLPVLPGGGFLEHTLLHQLRRQYPQDTPVPIHRLGRGTSGLMLLARSPLAKTNLSQQLRENTLNPSGLLQSNGSERSIRKVYRALAQGTDMPNTFTVTQPIGKIAHPNLGYIYGAIYDAEGQGKSAVSHCKVLKRHAENALIEVTILTGRPHQIRIHLAAAGYPLVGDPLYGVGGLPLTVASEGAQAIPVPGDCGYFLHAYQLTITHPRTRLTMEWTCPAPAILSPAILSG